MGKYDFINDLHQIRGVIYINEKSPLETENGNHILIGFDMENQDEGDLDTFHKILNIQKVVDWTVEYKKR